MSRHLYPLGLIVVLLLCLSGARAQRIGELGEDDKKASGALRYKAKGITDIEWSAVRTKEGDSETVTRVLQSLAGSNKRSLVQEEETITKVDAETTRVTRETSNFDSRGNARVTEVIEEEHRVLANGEEHVERNILVPDSRGRLSVYRQEVQAKIPTSDNVTMTSTSVYLRDGSGKFQERERVQHSESKVGNAVEVEQTTQAIDANGRWAPHEKRTVTTTQEDGKPKREEERIYRKDSGGRLTLSDHVISTYGQDDQGNEQWTVETHSNSVAGTTRAPGGKLQLDRRVRIVSKKLSGNVEQTIEEVEQRSPANPRSGLEVVERTITTSRPLRNGGRELEIEIQGRDGSGRFKTIMTQKKTFSD